MANVMATHHESVQEFIKTLGLDPSRISRLTIIFAANDIVLLETTAYMYEEGMEEMTEIVKKYRLKAEEIEE